MKVLAISNWNMFSILIINLLTYICILLAYIYTINNVCDTWVENIFNSNFFFLLNFDVNAIELKKERTWGEVCLTSGDKDQWQTIH